MRVVSEEGANAGGADTAGSDGEALLSMMVSVGMGRRLEKVGAGGKGNGRH